MAEFEAPPETRKFVIRLLAEPSVRGIDFHFGGLHIRNVDTIGNLIGAGRVHVWVKESMPRANAEYDSLNNRIYLSDVSVDNDLTRIAIVHEAVHTYCDYRRAAGYRFSEEGAAYVAERIYAQSAGISYSTSGDPVLWAALNIVRRHNMAATPGVRLSYDDYRPLYTALSRDRGYRRVRNIRINNDGIA